jgi:hypothetical protein
VTTGCRQSPPERCTLSALCIERGETCGDDGVCVPQALPTQPIDQLDAAVNFDAGVASADGSTDAPRADAPSVVDAGIDRTPPRLIAPMSTSRVAQPRPTLRFELPQSATDAVVELCSDRAMSAGCSSFSASSGSAAVPSARQRGWSYWRVTARRMGAALSVSPVWQFYVGSGTPSTTVSTVIGKILDLNGDGRVDLAVASRNPEEVAVYNGGPTGLGDAPAIVLAAPAGASLFGRSVDAAGDINGDRIGDLVIGAPGGGPGRAFVYFGRPSGVSATPERVLNWI